MADRNKKAALAGEKAVAGAFKKYAPTKGFRMKTVGKGQTATQQARRYARGLQARGTTWVPKGEAAQLKRLGVNLGQYGLKVWQG
jgi:hypothetical protein